MKQKTYDRNRLIISDMDGTLFDTSEVNYKSYYEAGKMYNYDINHTCFMEAYKRGENYRTFLPRFGVTEENDLIRIHETKKRLYLENLNVARINQDLFNILQNMRQDYQTALVTTASRKNVAELLYFFKIEEFFDIIITQEDVKSLKPDPECYNKVIQIAGVEKYNTLIFEDSDNGVKAACLSGAKVFRVECF